MANKGTTDSSGAKLVSTPDGTKRWYLNGELHRDDGPAYEGIDGTKMWFRMGKLHREDGPAMIQPNGAEEFWINGQVFTAQAFAEKLALEAKEKRAREQAEAARKQAEIDGAHQKTAEDTHDRLRRAAKSQKPPKLGKP